MRSATAQRVGIVKGSVVGAAPPDAATSDAPTPDIELPLLRFGTFELDPATGELTRRGRRVPLQHQPARVLGLLVARSGQLVTRQELRRTLWSDDTFVEFETALNIVVTKIRHALGDAAASPRFIETVPKRGYRFIADVHRAERFEQGAGADTGTRPDEGATPTTATSGAGARPWAITAWVALGVVVVLGCLIAGFRQVVTDDARPRSMAVLPFQPLVAHESDERFELGVTEALINQLSRIPMLRVEALGRVRRYSRLDQDPLEAGRALGVDAVLVGHFQRLDGRVHVRSRLLRTADGTALATNEWRAPFADIFEVQNGVAQSVTSALELTLTPGERARVRKPETSSAEAFRHYLFGRHYLEVRDIAQMREAEREFRKALRLDPQYARAHAALSLALGHQVWLDGPQGIEVMGPAKEAALKALAIDDSLALGHTALARVYEWFDYDAVQAQREHLRAMELDGQDLWVLRSYGHFLLNRDAFAEALELNRRELELDPTSPLSNRYRAQMLFVARRYDECAAQSQRTLSLDPRDLALPYGWLSRCLEQQGRRREAVETWEQGRALRGQSELAEKMKGIYHARGWNGYWRERIRIRGGPPDVALFEHLRLGNLDEAMRSLERLYELRHPVISWTNHPEWDPLRSDARFRALRQRAGLGADVSARLAAARRTARRPPLLTAPGLEARAR